MPFGLTSTGFVPKRQADIQAELIASLRASPAFGPEADFAADTVLGNLVLAYSLELAQVWELGQSLYSSMSLNASGAALDNVLSMMGVERLSATKARGVVRCYGTNTTVIPPAAEPPTSGGVFQRLSDGARFLVLPKSDGTDWTIASGYVDVNVEAELAGALTVDNEQIGGDTGEAARTACIVYAIPGLDGVWNPATESGKPNLQPFVSGTDVETDAAMRRRAIEDTKGLGSSTDQAIRRRVIQSTTPDGESFLTACNVHSNRTLTAEGSGQPGKSFWVVVWPNALSAEQQQAILEAIWGTMPAGIEPWPGPAGPDRIEGTVTDESGQSQSIGFSYATEMFAYLRVQVVTDALLWPATGAQDVRDAIAAYGEGLSVGDDVLSSDLIAAVAAVPGVRDVKLQLRLSASDAEVIATYIATGTWPSYIASVTVATNEIPRFAATSGRIAVEVS
mgnify:CR=1 FL=1|jgi:uncharacterized phage protein gp47/JayE